VKGNRGGGQEKRGGRYGGGRKSGGGKGGFPRWWKQDKWEKLCKIVQYFTMEKAQRGRSQQIYIVGIPMGTKIKGYLTWEF